MMNYKLHYVASGKNGIYGQQVFIEEALRIGVNRSLPHFILKKLTWGDKIFTANFESRHAGERGEPKFGPSESEEPEFKDRRFQDGIANVFGLFTVDGINLRASDELKQKLYSQLNIVSTINPNVQIKRSCGSYVLESSHMVTDSVEEIITKAQNLAVDMNEKVKYFVGGRFHEFQTRFEGINFSRSLIEVHCDYDIDLDQDFSQDKITTVGFIKDYEKRMYVPKKERANAV